MIKPGPERFQGIIDALLLRLREVTIVLDFALDVLELGLELLFRLNTLHQHHVVVTVHLDELVIHGSQGHIFILLTLIARHILLNELLLGCGHPRLIHDCIASGNKRGRPLLRLYHLLLLLGLLELT